MKFTENLWKRSLATLILSAATVCAFAQTDGQMPVGYSGREVAKSSEWGLEQAGEISAAIKIDPAILQNLTGVRVCGVNAGLASRLNVEGINVWVRTDLNGENLAEKASKAKKGWNDIVFDTPCSIPAGECYVGYTVTLSDTSYPVSVVPGNSEYGFFLNTGDGWESPETTEPYVLSLLAVISADNLTQYDLGIENVAVPSRMKIGSHYQIEIALANKGSRTVTGANIRCYENSEESGLFAVDCVLAPGEKGAATIDYTPIGSSKKSGCELKIAIESLAEGADEGNSDNEWTAEFNLCKYDFLKRVFLEEFTTQKCTNCPRAAEMLHQMLEMPEYSDRIVMCARHSGFGTDIYTSDTDLEMLEMYGGESTYCPAIMIDRTPFYSDGVPVTSVPGDLSDLLTLVDRCLGQEASVDITATAEYDAVAEKVRVKVTGGRDSQFGRTQARISVYLVENDLYDRLQKGADGDYYQQHVVRAADTTWGTVLNWDTDDEFSYECLLDPSKVKETANTEIVVAVHDHDPSDISNRHVDNSFSTKQIEWGAFGNGAGSDGITRDDVTTEYFDLQGRRLKSIDGAKGIVLKKVIYTDGTTESEKIIY